MHFNLFTRSKLKINGAIMIQQYNKYKFLIQNK